MGAGKKDYELSFEDVLLLRLGLIELKRSYSSLSEGLADVGLFDDSADFKERLVKIDKLDSIVQW